MTKTEILEKVLNFKKECLREMDPVEIASVLIYVAALTAKHSGVTQDAFLETCRQAYSK